VGLGIEVKQMLWELLERRRYINSSAESGERGERGRGEKRMVRGRDRYRGWDRVGPPYNLLEIQCMRPQLTGRGAEW
jgi:hypothetical protein